DQPRFGRQTVHCGLSQPRDRQVDEVAEEVPTSLLEHARAIESCHHNNRCREFAGAIDIQVCPKLVPCHDRRVRRTISALTTVAAAAVLAAVTVFVPSMPQWV